MMDINGTMSWGGGYMWLIWVVLLVAVVFAVNALSNNSNGKEQKNETPLDILKRRFASGEINADEYEQNRKKLG